MKEAVFETSSKSENKAKARAERYLSETRRILTELAQERAAHTSRRSKERDILAEIEAILRAA